MDPAEIDAEEFGRQFNELFREQGAALVAAHGSGFLDLKSSADAPTTYGTDDLMEAFQNAGFQARQEMLEHPPVAELFHRPPTGMRAAVDPMAGVRQKVAEIKGQNVHTFHVKGLPPQTTFESFVQDLEDIGCGNCDFLRMPMSLDSGSLRSYACVGFPTADAAALFYSQATGYCFSGGNSVAEVHISECQGIWDNIKGIDWEKRKRSLKRRRPRIKDEPRKNGSPFVRIFGVMRPIVSEEDSAMVRRIFDDDEFDRSKIDAEEFGRQFNELVQKQGVALWTEDGSGLNLFPQSDDSQPSADARTPYGTDDLMEAFRLPGPPGDALPSTGCWTIP